MVARCLRLAPGLIAVGMGFVPGPAAAQVVDVSLTVEAVETPAGPPTLAFTGFPMVVLLALLAILIAGGALMRTLGRERARTTGKGN